MWYPVICKTNQEGKKWTAASSRAAWEVIGAVDLEKPFLV